MKRCSMSLIIREMKVKTTMRYHLGDILFEWLLSKDKNKSWRGCGKKRTLIHFWWEYKLRYPQWKTVWRFPKILKIELSYALATHIWVFIQRKMKNSNLKSYLYPHMHCSIICNSQDMEATWMSTDRWVVKDDVVCISPHDYYSAIKRMKFCHLQ